MLLVSNRLKNKKDFDRVFKLGTGANEGFLFLKSVKNNLESSRFGFIISTKFSKKAVVRNRFRRKISEAVRINMDKIKKGFDCVIMAKPGLKEDELDKKVINLLSKAKLI